MMATVPHVISGLGLRKFQANGFLLTRVYKLILSVSNQAEVTLQLRVRARHIYIYINIYIYIFGACIVALQYKSRTNIFSRTALALEEGWEGS